MPLLESALSNVPGLKNITTQKPKTQNFVSDDYKDGFLIEEFENGKSKNGGREDINLTGPFMPHQPFTFGGEQRLVSTYYPGNSEPTVQVMGSKENDLTIKGELRLKKFKRIYKSTTDDAGSPSLTETEVRQIAQEFQELIDAMRIRGNLVRLSMGEWQRWGFIQSVSFDLYTLAKITYEIKFLIVGFNQPINTKLSQGHDDNLIKPNKDLTDAALGAIAGMQQFPPTMPRTISEFLNQEIGQVASAINLVTGFVNEALSDAEQLNNSLNRAIGLIKNARAVISQSARRINSISLSFSSLGSSVLSEWQKTTATVKSVNHIHDMRGSYTDLASMLAGLQARFEALRKTIPLQRYRVVNGDNLQKISTKFYNTPDHWQDIYDHNKLTDTQLVVGSVLEIPKV